MSASFQCSFCGRFAKDDDLMACTPEPWCDKLICGRCRLLRQAPRRALAFALPRLAAIARGRRQGHWWYTKRARLFARAERQILKVALHHVIKRAFETPLFKDVLEMARAGLLEQAEIEAIFAADVAAKAQGGIVGYCQSLACSRYGEPITKFHRCSP